MSVNEQQVTMSASIATMEGVGPATCAVFFEAGFTTIQQLKFFDAEDRKLWAAIERLKLKYHFDNAHWRRMMTRCLNVIYRARGAQSSDYVPHDYMCPISLDWYRDPVCTPEGQSFSKQDLLESLEHSPTNPVSRQPLKAGECYPNLALAAVVEHYRIHHQPYGIAC